MALLGMCISAGIHVAAAHVNYHHRPQAEQEEAWVREYCAEHGIVCHVRNEAFHSTGNFEADARKWRYEFFVSLVREYGYAGVLVAHQEDDLIETYLMQEEKGIIPAYYGLQKAMMYEGVQVRRPLLDQTKQELQDYCERNGIRYWLDETNASDLYTRNRIRHETVEPMDAFMRRMIRREIDEKNARLHEQRCRVYALIQDDGTGLTDYRKLPQADRLTLLRKLIIGEQPGMTSGYLQETDRIIMTHDDLMITLKHGMLVNDRGRLRIVPEPLPYAFICNDLQELASLQWSSFRVNEPEPGVNAVTLTEADYPVTLRSWQPGDAISLRYGTKHVHRFFIDRHIPRFRRRSWPVLVNAQGNVVLVPGIGCDTDHYSAEPSINIEPIL